MRWERPFLALAAANNAVWAVFVAVVPEWVFARVPPWPGAVALTILAVGACLAASAVGKAPLPFLVGFVAKALGPFVFLFAVDRGFLETSSWPLVLVTDLVWLPPLFVLWRRFDAW